MQGHVAVSCSVASPLYSVFPFPASNSACQTFINNVVRLERGGGGTHS